MQEVKTINSMSDLLALINTTSETIYCRHSQYPEKDMERGFSINWANGSREPGLSFNTLGVGDGDEDQMHMICRVLDIYQSKGLKCWIGSGERVGTGTDNEPCLENVEMVARVSNKCLRQALAWNMVHIYHWPTAEEKLKAAKVVAMLKACCTNG